MLLDVILVIWMIWIRLIFLLFLLLKVIFMVLREVFDDGFFGYVRDSISVNFLIVFDGCEFIEVFEMLCVQLSEVWLLLFLIITIFNININLIIVIFVDILFVCLL